MIMLVCSRFRKLNSAKIFFTGTKNKVNISFIRKAPFNFLIVNWKKVKNCFRFYNDR